MAELLGSCSKEFESQENFDQFLKVNIFPFNTIAEKFWVCVCHNIAPQHILTGILLLLWLTIDDQGFLHLDVAYKDRDITVLQGCLQDCGGLLGRT